MSILAAGFRPGEKGVRGVDGPLVLDVPAEVRFMGRVLVAPMGDFRLDEDASEDIDCEVERDGFGSATGFAAFSRLEKSPMVDYRSTVTSSHGLFGRRNRRSGWSVKSPSKKCKLVTSVTVGQEQHRDALELSIGS